MNFNGVKTLGSGYSVKGRVAASQYVGYGTFVMRSADGTIKMVDTGTNVHGYIGVADDDVVTQPTYEGMYDAGALVNVITNGVVNAWLLGGSVVYPGDYLKFPATLGAGTEPLGVLDVESSVTRTLDSVARYIGQNDAGNADYDQSCASISGSVVTCAGLADLDMVEGDFIVIDSDEGAEFNVVADPDTSSTTFTCVKAPLATHANAIKVYKLTQILVNLE